jgi:hypothetical protein
VDGAGGLDEHLGATYERLIGQFDTASRELIDGMASDCHDDCSEREYQNVYVVLALSLIAGYGSVRAARFK